jgi:pyridoxamine 5'-phosphate oxidase
MLNAEALSLFQQWLNEAATSEPNDPEAMCLSTVSNTGAPSARMVLLKGHDERGFVFYTNNHSRKAQDLREGAPVALTFHWKSLRRQIRIEGTVSPVTGQEADAYFASRARKSQLGAWASDQSAILPSRALFEARLAEAEARFEGKDVPRPPHWGGWRVAPRLMEFWQDMPFRLHDRTVYERTPNGWDVYKLYP